MAKQQKEKKEDKGEFAEEDMHEGHANANIALLSQMGELKAKIFRNAVFNDIAELKPLEIGQGGSQEPFNLVSYRHELEESGVYNCSGNLWWCNVLSLGMPHIHTNLQNINTIKSQFMATAAKCDLKEMVIQVDDITKDPQADGLFGKMKLLSCEEFPFAFMQKVCEDIDGEDLEFMLAHKKTMLTVKLEFRHFKSEKKRNHWMIDYREKVVGHGDAAARTPLQRAEEIAKKRRDILGQQDSKRKIGAKVVQKHIEKEYEGVQWGPSSDRINFNSVDVLLTLFDRMFSDSSCREIVIKGEEFFAGKGDTKKSPFHSLTKLEAVVKKAKALKNVKWYLNQMLWAVSERQLDAGEIAANYLLGKHKRGNMGLVDHWLFQRDVAMHMRESLKDVAPQDWSQSSTRAH